MDLVLYFILDCLDTLAIYFLMMSIFQYPIREYLKEVMLICSLLALESILFREILKLSIVDTLIHILLLIICLRYIIKIRWFRAIRIVAVGVLGYFAIQMIVSSIVLLSGLFSSIELDNSLSLSSIMVQITAQAFAFLAALIVQRFDLGTTKYIRPPHDFYIVEKFNAYQLRILVISAISLLASCSALYFLVHHNEIFIYCIISIFLFLVVLILTYRRDKK